MIRDSKVRIKSKNNKRESDTLGITMELEKSLSIGDQLEKERKNLKSNLHCAYPSFGHVLFPYK